MSIDWFTFGAQIANFLVLLLLLKRFLYRPVIDAMERRRHALEERLREAERRRKEAAELEEECTRRGRELERARDDVMARAREEADAWRKEALAGAREEVEERREAWRREVDRERDGLVRELRERAVRQVLDVARRAVHDLADEALEERILQTFLRHLERLPEERWAPLREAAAANAGAVRVATAVDAPPDAAASLERVLRAHLGEGIDVSFETSPSLLCGAEVRVGDLRLGWNAERWLDGLDRAFAAALESGASGAEGHAS